MTHPFLAATKLSTAVATPSGHHPDSIGDNPGLAGITSGNFRINGFNISVDVSTDSINDIVNRINVPAGVTATFDLQTDELSIKVKTIREPVA